MGSELRIPFDPSFVFLHLPPMGNRKEVNTSQQSINLECIGDETIRDKQHDSTVAETKLKCGRFLELGEFLDLTWNR